MNNTDIVKKGLKARYAREKRFQLYGKLAVSTGFVFLAILLVDIIIKASPAFQTTEIQLDIPLDHATLELPEEGQVSEQTLRGIDYLALIKKALRNAYPEVKKRKDKKELYKLVSSGAEFALREKVINNPSLVGTASLPLWVLADDDVDTYYKLNTKTSRISDTQAAMIQKMT